MIIKNKIRWTLPKGKNASELDRKIMAIQEKGHLVPTRSLIKTKAQIEGIRESGKINTGVLDCGRAYEKEWNCLNDKSTLFLLQGLVKKIIRFKLGMGEGPIIFNAYGLLYDSVAT